MELANSAEIKRQKRDKTISGYDVIIIAKTTGQLGDLGILISIFAEHIYAKMKAKASYSCSQKKE